MAATTQTPIAPVRGRDELASVAREVAITAPAYDRSGELPWAGIDAANRPILQLHEVTKHFRLPGKGGIFAALTGVSLTVSRGRTHALIGESGSGKTIATRIALGLEHADGAQFQFLSLPRPGADGLVPVDFNRAYLPPCAFSDHYLCPLPPPENRLPFPVTAGETVIVRSGAD